MAFSHVAHCPEVSPAVCADPDIEMEPHEHHQGVTMIRHQTSVSYGLGKGWQIFAQIPVDAKIMTIEYATLDGRPYDPPYGDIHHRNETLMGLGDGRVEAQRFVRLSDGWVMGAGLGTTVPLGRTEENPFIAAQKSEEHQHMQMGSGTFDPTFSASSVWSGHQWGATLAASGSLALMENSKGYKPSSVIQVGGGPTYRFNAKFMAATDLTLTRENQAEWDGTPDYMSGRTALTGGAALIYRLNPQWATMVQAQSTLLQWSEASLIVQRFKGTIGISWTPQGKGKAGDYH